jgi:hypothetical protein
MARKKSEEVKEETKVVDPMDQLVEETLVDVSDVADITELEQLEELNVTEVEAEKETPTLIEEEKKPSKTATRKREKSTQVKPKETSRKKKNSTGVRSTFGLFHR